MLITPKTLLNAAKHPFRYAHAASSVLKNPSRYLGSSKVCYVCKKTFGSFVPYRGGTSGLSPFIRELALVGSDVDNFGCPCCGCHDRERHLWMYFDKLDIWQGFKNVAVLHFAPEHAVMSKIQTCNPSRYVKADLSPQSADMEKIDVCSISYPAGYFQAVICNHVLEHVPDDRRALSELFRVLKPEGYAILQTPYSSLLESTFTDAAINSSELRHRFYGQEDHVRLYGRDLFTRIENAGFTLRRVKHRECLMDFDASLYGVNQDEDFILAVKEK